LPELLTLVDPLSTTILRKSPRNGSITLNVCLGKEFTGGELFFRGVRCAEHQETPWRPDEEFDIVHVPGRAILHRGRHRHGAHPITGGERYNLILWCGSSAYQGRYEKEHVPGWCGEHR
jgi:hypothetical protein